MAEQPKTNGEKKMLWKAVTTLLAVVTILIGTVWGITWGSSMSRISKVEDKSEIQGDRLASIEGKIDILIEMSKK